MSDSSINVLAVVGSPRDGSSTRIVIQHVSERLRVAGCNVDVLDLHENPVTPYNPDTAYDAPGFSELKKRVDQADVYILGTPDYHGSVSSTLKNFLDYFWKEFAGKLFATVVASHEKGLTVTDQLRTIARQCYAWCLPYGVSFMEKADVNDGQIVSDGLHGRLEMFVHDVHVYGALLAQQRRTDLAGTEPGFLAKHRTSNP